MSDRSWYLSFFLPRGLTVFFGLWVSAGRASI